jgi:hypothetical protein
MKPCDEAKKLKTYIRALERAESLGHKTLEDCIIERISTGTTVSDLAGKLDVSEHWLDQWLKKLNIRSCHQRKVKFWGV